MVCCQFICSKEMAPKKVPSCWLKNISHLSLSFVKPCEEPWNLHEKSYLRKTTGKQWSRWLYLLCGIGFDQISRKSRIINLNVALSKIISARMLIWMLFVTNIQYMDKNNVIMIFWNFGTWMRSFCYLHYMHFLLPRSFLISYFAEVWSILNASLVWIVLNVRMSS